MRKFRFLLLLMLLFGFHYASLAQKTGNHTYTYDELIRLYHELADSHPEIALYNMGDSDYGLPVYLCVLNAESDSVSTFEKAQNSTTILINNGIHPGEPDGINACVNWIFQWIKDGKQKDLPLIAIIPAYNVGGMMNRSSTSRANQNGPEEYGFRGNAANLDLNRDFMKMDSRNMFAFARIFHALDPDVFIDTHVSNGADYQYTLTGIAPLRERLVPAMERITYDELLPEVSRSLREKGSDYMQYIELRGETPEQGLEGFNDLPRYASGYTSLFNTISFTSETHMLKPFPQRVQATFDFLDVVINYMRGHAAEIELARKNAFEEDLKRGYYPIRFTQTGQPDSILFKGYEAGHRKSEVSGLSRLYYDRTKPYEKYIPNYNQFKSLDSVKIPEFYVVGAQCHELIARLEANGVHFETIEKDTTCWLTAQRVTAYETVKNVYEGHYLHYATSVSEERIPVTLKPGDLLISTSQPCRNLLVNLLEAKAEDSYFAWNFLDSYLQQKEYFSPYVFEDIAAELLKKDPELRAELEQAIRVSPELAQSAYLQLVFVYEHSAYHEQTVNLLPVYKLYPVK